MTFSFFLPFPSHWQKVLVRVTSRCLKSTLHLAEGEWEDRAPAKMVQTWCRMVQVAKLAAAGDYDELQKYLQEVQTWLVWKLFSVLSMKCSGSSFRKVLRSNCVICLMQSACAGRSKSKLLQRLGVILFA